MHSGVVDSTLPLKDLLGSSFLWREKERERERHRHYGLRDLMCAQYWITSNIQILSESFPTTFAAALFTTTTTSTSKWWEMHQLRKAWNSAGLLFHLDTATSSECMKAKVRNRRNSVKFNILHVAVCLQLNTQQRRWQKNKRPSNKWPSIIKGQTKSLTVSFSGH